jgi:hypothetical protein
LGLAVGLHLFLRWLYAGIQSARPEEARDAAGWRIRWTAMTLTLGLLMFVAGISVVGAVHQTGWLLRSPERLFTSNSSLRIAAARLQSSNNLKVIGFAAYNIAENEKTFPAATFDAGGNALHGWHTHILPYIEQNPLYRSIDLAKPWNDPKNLERFKRPIYTFQSPGGGERQDAEGLALSHYASNGRVLGATALKADAITDGTSNTILAGEVWAAYRPWGHPIGWRDPALGIHTTPGGFGSPVSKEYAQFVMADGSVRRINSTVSRETLKALSTPDGGEMITEDW